ncbi:sigma-70 family RNA polymerase sigma factor [Dinghuibacter silviterrae]|uniref:RNA polymerase sigma-70 factor (ECF subfamily) n=1 Tax=Dinghuibacter silviterrae TaxID=1539049 RepID=A0A4R8DNI7_9BACT|nr:sigma-70 family RNA polymerase sigma factor [Dinghuibacter silviterrae]TDW99609.1 RNA polymerase sigma-70 factor (ECF subfamily) [Dinghuibacter silviterrae]
MHTCDPNLWVDQYADLLYRFALVRVSDGELARDLVQETFIAAWKGLGSFEGQASEKTWLYSILRNKIVDHYRAEARNIVGRLEESREDEHVFFDEAEHWRGDTAPRDWGGAHGSSVEKKEFYGVLERCKEKLARIQAAVFTMKYLDDLDSEDICKELCISSSNYWVLLHRAKLHLRQCLERNWFV